MTKREWTDAEVEWAARCLYREDYGVDGWTYVNVIPFRARYKQMVRHALDHGYRPPKPKSVREELVEIVGRSWPVRAIDAGEEAVDELLARFNVTRKETT